MKNIVPGIVVCGASLLLILTGCREKSDANSELEKAVAVLQQPVSGQSAAPTQVQSAQMPAASAAPAQEMRQAIQSFKGGNLEDAVTRLQKLRAAPLLTPEQRIAVNDAIAAVMNEVTALAEKGDAHAIQAAEQFRRMQTERR